MDANGNIIFLTEDDQGEGIKDPLEIDDVLRANPYYFEQPNVLEKMMDFNRRKEIYKKP